LGAEHEPDGLQRVIPVRILQLDQVLDASCLHRSNDLVMFVSDAGARRRVV
jgi:hypothetical protein